MSRDVTTSFARTLVDEWARNGVTHAVVAPGSRSTPLALALAADVRIDVHVLVDERSAGGFAVGIGRASGAPAVLVCTSGTAAALFHAAVLEAHHGRVPLARLHRRSAARAARRRRGPDDRPDPPVRRRRPLVARSRSARGPAGRGRPVASRRGARRPPRDRSARRPRAPQPPVPRAARPDGRAARRSARPCRRCAVRVRHRCAADARTHVRRSAGAPPCAHIHGVCSSRAGVPRSSPRRPLASPRPPVGRSSPIRCRTSAAVRSRCRPTTPSRASPRTSSTSSRRWWCASVRRRRARRSTAGSSATCPRCWSTPTACGSIRLAARRRGSPPMPARCWTRSPSSSSRTRSPIGHGSTGGGRSRTRRVESSTRRATPIPTRSKGGSPAMSSRPSPTARRWWSHRACRSVTSSRSRSRARVCASSRTVA